MYQSKDLLLKKMQHYCAYQDRCQLEAEQKLRQLGATEDQAGDIMVELIQEGFLNEERFRRPLQVVLAGPILRLRKAE